MGAQLFIRLDMPSLAAVCAFARGASRLLNGLGRHRGRGTEDAGIDCREARGLGLLTGMSALLVSLQSSEFFPNAVIV